MARSEIGQVIVGMSSAIFDDICQVLPEHIPEIFEIEKAAYPFPWTEGMLTDCLKTNYYFYAMFRQGRVIAYGVMSCILDESHILNLCVSPEYQKQGLGKKMLCRLLDKARVNQSHTVFLEVRESNHTAQHLYEDIGFNRLGNRKEYYPDEVGREDAIIYAKELVITPV